jgi:hypothetical protein
VRAMNCYYSNLIEGHDTHPHLPRPGHLHGRADAARQPARPHSAVDR